jgi:hypothetical protein
MSLERRVARLEQDANKASGNAAGASPVHVHEAGEDPREHCHICMAMTEKEYEEWLTDVDSDSGPHVVIIEVHRVEQPLGPTPG